MIPPAKTPGTLRFLTLNLWGENGPWQGRISLLLDSVGALEPDVIGLQEVREAPGRVPNHAGEIARRLGWNHVFAPSSAWGGGHEGLAIVSRFPIGAHEAQPLPHSVDTEGRIILSARIELVRRMRRRSGSTRRTCRIARRKGASARTRCCSSTR